MSSTTTTMLTIQTTAASGIADAAAAGPIIGGIALPMLPLLVPSSAGDCAAARLSSGRAPAGGCGCCRCWSHHQQGIALPPVLVAGGHPPEGTGHGLRLRGSAGGGSTTATPLRHAPSSVSGRRGRAVDLRQTRDGRRRRRRRAPVVATEDRSTPRLLPSS